MKKSNLYTGTGDSGTTSLIGGTRVPKDSARLEAYGTLDEFSSHLGLIEALPETPHSLKEILQKIQNKLFSIGAYLATPATEKNPQPQPVGLSENDIAYLEKSIDAIDQSLKPMKCFILPGGTVQSAQAHIARTVCRRAERRIVTLSTQTYVSPLVIKYLNRLSDLLFAIARLYNSLLGCEDIPWKNQ